MDELRVYTPAFSPAIPQAGKKLSKKGDYKFIIDGLETIWFRSVGAHHFDQKEGR